MGKTLITTAAIMAVFLAGTATLSAQEKKQVEKKVVIVTVEDDGITQDTTIIEGDTLNFESGNLIINTREGRRIIRKPGEGSRMVWVENEGDMPMTMPMHEPGMRPAMMMRHMQPEKEGVSYNISVDGVVVNIRAPKEKAKEADRILSEVKKILMAK
ncbi:hypothetical protein EG830_16040 [bacterium]|nr:hypothetical protein [bacterium]